MRPRKTAPKVQTAEDAVKAIRSFQRVFVHSVSMAPQTLIQALCNRAEELREVELIHVHTEGIAPYVEPRYAGSFRHNACFVGPNVRSAVQAGDADYIPVFLSEMPLLFRRGILPIDVAMISVSPPDAHGYCSLGTSVDIAVGALESARYVLAEVNPQVPRTHGDGVIHWRELDAVVYTNTPVAREHAKMLSSEEVQIGKNIAALVEDGATLQMGIGAIPDAVLSQLIHHRKLGIHTEMFSDGLLPLLELGAVTGENKKILPGKVVATFAMGSEKLMRFVDDNPSVLFRDAAFTNDTANIRRNPKVTAINSAIEIDLTGQVCADSIGPMQFSGVGGQMDFIRGASLSEGGKPILALTSTTRRGENKIVPFLKEGAGVTTTRAHVHWVVTEFGSANLYGLNLRQRAKALIELAHPSFREQLEIEAWNRLHR